MFPASPPPPPSASLVPLSHLLAAATTTSYSFLAFNLCSLCLLASGLAKTELCLSPETASQTPRGKNVGSFGHCYLCSVHRAQPGSSPGHWPTCGVAAFVLEERKKVKSLSCVPLFATPWTVAYQVPLSMGFSRQEYWSGLPFPSPGDLPDSGIGLGSPAL